MLIIIINDKFKDFFTHLSIVLYKVIITDYLKTKLLI